MRDYEASLSKPSVKPDPAALETAEAGPKSILKKAKFASDDDVKMADPEEEAAAAEKKAKQEAALRKLAEQKALAAALAKENARKIEGRIGTLVVTKLGKVKMVLGDGIVMDVSILKRSVF